jgi:hypothetical protein
MGFRAQYARFTSKKRELMRAVLRLVGAVLAAGLALTPLSALAQDAATTQAAPSSTPATDAVGPRDLQNFSLNGTVTRSADPVAVSPRSASRRVTSPPGGDNTAASPAPSPSPLPAPADRTAARAPVRDAVVAQPAAQIPRAPVGKPAARPAFSVTTDLPPIDEAPVSSASSATLAPPADELGSEHRLLLWPWLLAALALGAGGAFLFWRSRSREAFADGSRFDAFVAPDAEPAPPRPATPPKAPPGPPSGVVSTRLRPSIELLFEPGRCIVEDDRVTIEFELGLQNSGNAPARAVLVEATLLNAGPYQDQEVGAFYAAPVGEGERIPLIPPLKTVMVKTKVVAPRANVRLVEIAGRNVFVPLIAFNALYGWATGEGQTSASYLLGRDTKSDKLAPFRLDLGPRIVRSVGARALPIAVHT